MVKVFFIPVEENESTASRAGKVKSLFYEAGLDRCFSEHDLVGIKMHFGEKENTTHISPELVRPLVEAVKKKGAKPFLTDTCVLYRSERDNAVDHLILAYEHGFTIEKVGAPVIIADGLVGNVEKDMEIPGKIFNEVSLASAALEANGLLVLSHVTGHISTGMGACLKNLGMGFASRKGKLRQHSVMKPAISEKRCTGCGLCVRWCPTDAIRMSGEKAVIDSGLCIGCGECLTVCRFGAVKHDWRMDNRELQNRMAEHAFGVVRGREQKIGYMNFLISVTKDCDCLGKKQDPIMPDIGILAGMDPVALDAASLELIAQKTGRSLESVSYPQTDGRFQISHAESLGMGSSVYELVTVK